MLNIQFHTQIQLEDNSNHLLILKEAFKVLRWLHLCMEEEEGITDLMKEEAVLSMDLGKFLQNTFGPCF